MITSKSIRFAYITTALVLVGLFIYGIIMFGYISSFTRFILDDFCMGQSLNQYGFWGAQKWWYINWDGRYVFTFFIHVAALLGPKLMGVFPIIILTLKTILLFFISYCLLSRYKITKVNKVISSLLASSCIAFWTLRLTADVSESFYWVSSMLTYYLPIMAALGGTLAIILFYKAKRLPWYNYLIVGFTFLFAAGSSETFSIILLLLTFVSFIYLYFSSDRKLNNNLVKLVMCALISTLVGITIMVVAPGNKIRQSYFPTHPSINNSIDQAVDASTEYFSKLVTNNKYAFVLILLIGVLFSLISQVKIKNRSVYFFIAGGITLLVIWASYVASIYATSSSPPNRVLIIPTFFLITFVFYSGLLLGSYINSTRIVMGTQFMLISIICLVSLLASYKSVKPALLYLYSDRVGYSQFAKSYDIFDAKIRSSNKEDDLVFNKYSFVNNHQAAQLEDSSHWINRCISGYYKVKSVSFE